MTNEQGRLTPTQAAIELDVFLAAYPDEPDDGLVERVDDDDLLTWGTLRTLLAALKPPPIAGDLSDPVMPNSAAEWDLEQRAFDAANSIDVPDRVRSLVADLWREFVRREPTTSGDVGKLCEALLDPSPFYAGTYARKVMHQAATLLTQMEAREQAMREALEPFAKWASWYDGMLAADDAIAHGRGEIGGPPSYITVGQLRTARALLNPTPTEER